MKPRRNEEAQAHIGLSSHTKKKVDAVSAEGKNNIKMVLTVID
jgi:hypothetical protein